MPTVSGHDRAVAGPRPGTSLVLSASHCSLLATAQHAGETSMRVGVLGYLWRAWTSRAKVGAASACAKMSLLTSSVSGSPRARRKLNPIS
jgi:hypothetical protein